MKHTSPQPSDRAGAGGVALLLVLVVLAAAALIATAFLSAMNTAAMAGRDFSAQARARLIAESGLELTVAHLRDNPAWRSEQPNGIWVADEPYADGHFTIRVEDGRFDQLLDAVVGDGSLADDLTDPATITSTGTVDGVSHTVRCTVIPQFVNVGGLSVSGDISLSNSASIDGWNSALGPYGSLNSGPTALVTTNSTIVGAVTLNDNAIVHGSVFIGPGAMPSAGVITHSGSDITGAVQSLPQPVPLDEPQMPSTPLPTLGDVSYGGTITTISTDMHVNNLTLAQSTVLTISGNVNIYCDGKFLMRNSSRLILTAGSTLNLYVAGDFAMEQYADFNTSLPELSRANVQVFGAGGVELDNYTEFHGNLRAPPGDLTMHQHAQFYGTFQGAGLHMSNNAGLHQDLNPAVGNFPLLASLTSIWYEPR